MLFHSGVNLKSRHRISSFRYRREDKSTSLGLVYCLPGKPGTEAHQTVPSPGRKETCVQYYTVDSRKLTFAEYRRMSRGFAFLIAALLKALRIRMPIPMAVTRPEELLIRQPSELPQDIYARLVPLIAPCEREGLRVGFFYEEPMVAPSNRTLGVAMLSDDRLVYGFLAEAENKGLTGPTRQVDLSLLTPLSDGRYLATALNPKAMDSPPQFFGISLPDAKAEEIVASHRERLRSLQDVRAEPIEGRLEDFVLEIGRLSFDFHVGRGVYVPISDAEVEKLRAARPASAASSFLVWIAVFVFTILVMRSCG